MKASNDVEVLLDGETYQIKKGEDVPDKPALVALVEEAGALKHDEKKGTEDND